MVLVKKLTLLLCFVVFNSYALEISSFNIRNFDKKGKGTDKSELSRIFQTLNSDIIAIQEIYNNRSFQKYVTKYLPQYKLIAPRAVKPAPKARTLAEFTKLSV
jgi:endonuclease/exonuclease/phosphatase family metal-dependent hydrolase